MTSEGAGLGGPPGAAACGRQLREGAVTRQRQRGPSGSVHLLEVYSPRVEAPAGRRPPPAAAAGAGCCRHYPTLQDAADFRRRCAGRLCVGRHIGGRCSADFRRRCAGRHIAATATVQQRWRRQRRCRQARWWLLRRRGWAAICCKHQAAAMPPPTLTTSRCKRWAHVGKPVIIRWWAWQPHQNWPPCAICRCRVGERLACLPRTTCFTPEPALDVRAALCIHPGLRAFRPPLARHMPKLPFVVAVLPDVGAAFLLQVDAIL